MRPALRRIPLSLATALLLWALLAVALLKSPPRNILSWDTFGYHLYLPATLLHHDPGVRDVGWVHAAAERYETPGSLYQLRELPDGRWVMKYPMGLALLWSPFFVAGHVVAGIIGAPQDGFSAPYQWALIVAALVYALLGLVVLRWVLRLYFDERIAALLLVLIAFGTNYLHQFLLSTGMPHIFLFTLGAGVLWHSVQWHRQHRKRDALIIGLLLGLMVLSRPSEIVWVLLPMLIGLEEPREWKAHLRMLWSKRGQLVLMIGVATIICSPQLVYWKWMTGKWLYMSYNNPGEGFEFLHPFVQEVLFSFRKGWYIYTPLMLVATLGFFALRKQIPVLRWAIISFFVLNLFVVSSWSCWWYADSFGQRALVQSYPVMALALGGVLVWLREQRTVGRALVTVMIFAFAVLNVFQTWQSTRGMIHTSRMTRAAYCAVFGATKAPPDLEELFLIDRDGKEGPQDPDQYHARPLLVANNADGVEVPWNEVTSADHVWLEVRSATALAPLDTLKVAITHDGYAYNERVLFGNERRMLWYLSPEVRSPNDLLRVEHTGDPSVLTVILHEPIHSTSTR